MVTELIVSGPAPVATRSAISGSLVAGEGWVVITDRAGHHPRGTVPEGGVLVSTIPVTEAPKKVVEGRVIASLDRSGLFEVVVPIAIAGSTLAEILAESSVDPVDIVAQVLWRGGPIEAAP